MGKIAHIIDYYWRQLHIRDYKKTTGEKNAHITGNYWRQLHTQEYKITGEGKHI